MNPWMDAWARLTVLREKYGLGAAASGQSEMPVTKVPVIGPFSAGKSSLLNALAQRELLPVGITATTSFPTELRLGEDALRVHRNGSVETLELEALHSLDPAGVTRLEVVCDLPFLRRIPGLLLIDTPGLDSTKEQEALLREELKTCGGCILIFPAEAPVVKPGVAAVLSGLPADAPVLAFLNKCDKLLADELDACADYLRISLGKLPGMNAVPVGRISACERDVGPLREALLDLQIRVAQGQDSMAAAIREAALSLRRYLYLCLKAAELIGAGAEEQTAAFQAQMQHLRKWTDSERKRFETKLEECLRRAGGQVVKDLAEIALPVETLLGAGKNPTDYVEDFFRELVASCYQRDFLPDVKGCLYTIDALTQLREQETFTAPFADRISIPELQLGDDPFPGAGDRLSQALMSLNCLPRLRRRDAAKRMTASLLPALSKLAEESAQRILRRQADILRQEVENALLQEEILAEKAFKPFGPDFDEPALRADLEKVEAILSNH